MRLYRIKTKFWGKDLSKEAILGYVVANSEEEVAEHINQKYKYGEWFGYTGEDEDKEDYEDEEEYLEAIEEYRKEVMETKQDYLANKGDFHTDYTGEFYDQKYGWEEVGEVTDEQIGVLQNFGILEELRK